LFPYATPAAKGKPCPKDPVEHSTPFIFLESGCPPK